MYYFEVSYVHRIQDRWRSEGPLMVSKSPFQSQKIKAVYDACSLSKTDVDCSFPSYIYAGETMNGETPNDESLAWKIMRKRAQMFADVIGCPLPVEADRADVFPYLNAILSKGHQKSSESQVAELQARVDVLTKEKLEQAEKLRVYERTMACLAFRHVLERLPQQQSKKKESEKWQDFWDKAVLEANKRGGRTTPVSKVIETYGARTEDAAKLKNVDTIKRVGATLYNILSSNIHHSAEEFTLKPDQWDDLIRAILESIVPETKDIKTVEWDVERARFITPPKSSAPSTAPAKKGRAPVQTRIILKEENKLEQVFVPEMTSNDSAKQPGGESVPELPTE